MNKEIQKSVSVGRKGKTTRNFCIGTRNLLRAGKVCSHQSSKAFSTRGTLADRWTVFAKWLEDEHNISRMENITPEHVIQYSNQLKSRIDQGELKPSTAQLYVSAINSILKIATRGAWQSISPTKDCGIPRRKYLPAQSKSMPKLKHDRVINIVDERVGVMLSLQRTLGLRFKEAALIDAKKALYQANTDGYITVTSGTKGGKRREIPVSCDAKRAIERAADIQNGRSMVPKKMAYADFRRECYSTSDKHDFNFHAERHHYAQQRYQELSGAPAPISTGVSKNNWLAFVAQFLNVDLSTAESIDREARLTLSRELGHNRLEVVRVYIG
jgi:hypothetical protein